MSYAGDFDAINASDANAVADLFPDDGVLMANEFATLTGAAVIREALGTWNISSIGARLLR